MWQKLLRGTVWERGALDHEPKKFRSLWRIWLPLYDGIAMSAGLLAVFYGTRLLDRIFGDALTNVLGVFFFVVASLALLGVAYPRLGKLETAAKSLLIGSVIAYVYCILFLPSPEQLAQSEAPNYFVAAMLFIGLPLPMFRLNMLAEERFDRRVAMRVQELMNE